MWEPSVRARRRDLHMGTREVNFTSHLGLSFGAVRLPCRQLSLKTGIFIAHFNLPDLLPQRNRLPTTPPERRSNYPCHLMNTKKDIKPAAYETPRVAPGVFFNQYNKLRYHRSASETNRC